MSAAGFTAAFGRAPTVVASAPGRVNLIGEHTDYNEGFVLPLAIARRTTVALAPRGDDRVRATSAAFPEAGAVDYLLGTERRGLGWIDYIQGVTRTLRAEGHEIRGVDLHVASDVPVGSGLASSAALEVALVRALREAFALPLDDVALALVGHRAESLFVGARVGVMDQIACSLADETRALLIDTRSLATTPVPLPAGVELLVVDSGVAHGHAGGEYNRRREECERACGLLGVATLRDLTTADLPRALALPEPLGRRVRHVVTENARVLDAVAALRAGDAARVGALLMAGHTSLRYDYEVSAPEIDTLVALLAEDRDVCGARMTGGGFGGAVVALCRSGTARSAGARVAAPYGSATRRTATIVVPRPATD